MAPCFLNFTFIKNFYICSVTLLKNIMLRSFRAPINESEVRCPSFQSHKNIITDLNDVQISLRVTHLKKMYIIVFHLEAAVKNRLSDLSLFLTAVFFL